MPFERSFLSFQKIRKMLTLDQCMAKVMAVEIIMFKYIIPPTPPYYNRTGLLIARGVVYALLCEYYIIIGCSADLISDAYHAWSRGIAHAGTPSVSLLAKVIDKWF